MSINQRFKTIRKTKNLSQKSFSEIFNVKQATISQIESGKIMPSLDMIINITYKFNEINPIWLLTGEGEMLRTEGLESEKKPVQDCRQYKDIIQEQKELIKSLQENNKQLLRMVELQNNLSKKRQD